RSVGLGRGGYVVEALRGYRLAVEAGEDEQPVQEGMAEIYLLQRETQAGLDLYTKLLEREPGNPKFWNERGVVLQQAGRRDEARQAYEQAVAVDPAYALGWNNLG